MKKTIIAIALILVIACVLFTACKSKGGDETTTSTTSAESTTVEVLTDADTGESYVTNVSGDRIPITTGIDGSLDFIDELVTKTVEKVSEEASVIESQKQKAADTTKASTPSTTQSSAPATTEESSGIEIGDGDIFDEDKAAVIDWG